MNYFGTIAWWIAAILLTVWLTTIGCNLLNAATYPFESLLGLFILGVVGGFWLNRAIKGGKTCYEYLKVYLEQQ